MMTAAFLREDWRKSDPRGMSDLVRAGDFLWLRGQVAVDRANGIVGVGDIAAQTRQVFMNIRRVLSLADCDLSCIVPDDELLRDLDLGRGFRTEILAVRQELFGDHHPASTGVQVAGLSRPEFLIEVDVVGYAPTQADAGVRL